MGREKTLRDCLTDGRIYLKEHGINEYDLDAWYLMEYVWKMDRTEYFMKMQETADPEKEEEYQKILKRRASRIPLQQLTGEAWFYGRKFYVNEHVLIPRQDTEVLIEEVLKQMPQSGHLLDLCTGSGCILLTLLQEKPKWTGIGVDISAEALNVAEKNRSMMQVQAELLESDLFSALNREERFECIVSNPPYIPSAVITTLMDEVKGHEPVIALDGGEDGLYFYRKITREAKKYLQPGGLLCYEIGHDQGEALLQIFREEGYQKGTIVKDLAGLDRVAYARLEDIRKK